MGLIEHLPCGCTRKSPAPMGCSSIIVVQIGCPRHDDEEPDGMTYEAEERRKRLLRLADEGVLHDYRRTR